ncbi:cation diffusion facilitator family transporter [Paenibacillus allorhizosphaerae]|uniref:Manganese efflux system protein MneP n=1 Tax=Paenibacillus allorhizosphaerae TaxID=2849866 RepID=A0ABN7TTH2_9BACL|nr:cation diffusion facilitator family transporter [Paenibacillus allorhizosphaerae]CAG7655210.1 Manganese efflux system protein MneP [Paenibacillus allorhizosphaerae]
MTEERYKKTEFVAWIGIAGNIALLVLQGLVGYVAHSKALIADALHSASAAAGSIAILIGSRSGKRSLDDHRYARGKTESVAAMTVAVLLLVIGIEVGITSGQAIYYGVDEPPNQLAFIVVILSIIAKEVMFRYKYRLGKQLSSQTLMMNAWEHRSDVYSSIAAFIGVGGALLGHSLGNDLFYYLDPAAGLFISLLVVRKGYRLIQQSIHNTLGRILHQEDTAELLETVQRVKGVIAVDELRPREHGHYVIVDMKISVNPKITVQEGHDIAKIVKHTLMKRFIHVSDVFIHVNPYDAGYPYKNAETEADDYPTLLH